MIETFSKPELEKTCPICHKKFTTKSPQKKYCSDSCYFVGLKNQQNARKYRKRKEREKVVCLWCRESFMSVFSCKFCCSECRGYFHQMRNHIYTTYQFDSKKQDKEMKKLQKEGKKYSITGEK